MQPRGFDLLAPQVVVQAVEDAFDMRLDGTIMPYSSYVNRVYGLRSEDGEEIVAKFYRPGRWSEAAILEEQEFVFACEAAELPVVSPTRNAEGLALHACVAESDEGESEYLFSIFPKKSGRNFDAESDEDWIRLGAITGRMHAVGRVKPSKHRTVCTPGRSTAVFLNELEDAEVVTAELADEFFDLAWEVRDALDARFEGVPLHRLHGDCHRGNILDRAGDGLMLIDFDDMMMGPAVQDLWLLLPGRIGDSRRELSLLIEGYERFLPFDATQLGLIESLRYMRMVYYLAWCARQRHDNRFLNSFPNWGSKAFWIKEIEDLREQIPFMELEGF